MSSRKALYRAKILPRGWKIPTGRVIDEMQYFAYLNRKINRYERILDKLQIPRDLDSDDISLGFSNCSDGDCVIGFRVDKEE